MKTVFVDTNYFLRLLLKDNDQYQHVYDVFRQAAKGKIKLVTSVIVLFELYWVLASFYKRNKQEQIDALMNILKMDFVLFENRDIFHKALYLYSRYKIDLEDCYSIAFAKHFSLDQLGSFDKKVVKIFSSMT